MISFCNRLIRLVYLMIAYDLRFINCKSDVLIRIIRLLGRYLIWLSMQLHRLALSDMVAIESVAYATNLIRHAHWFALSDDSFNNQYNSFKQSDDSKIKIIRL